jgi:hypothetical protein
MRITFFFILILLLSSCSFSDSLFERVSSTDSGIYFSNTITEDGSFNILTEEYIFNGGGVVSADFTNDGFRDLFFTGNQVGNALYINKGDLVFEDHTEMSGIEMANQWATGATYADVNGDGWLDLYVCTAMNTENRRNILWINEGLDAQGKLSFSDQTEAFGLEHTGNSMGAVFFDYNKDGFLDLYVINNEQSESIPMNYRNKVVDGSAPSNDALFRNNGDGSFSNVTKEAGILVEGFGLGIVISDVNHDTWPDIVIANDYISNDLVYINQQDGTFLTAAREIFKHQSMFSMGVDAADINNDGYDDLIFLDMLGETNYRKKTTITLSNYQKTLLDQQWDYESQHSRNMLHLGTPDGLPSPEVGMFYDVYQTDWSWSPLFFDADNDGYRDLFITNGFPRDVTDKDFTNFRQGVENFVSSEVLLTKVPVIKQKNYAYQNIEGKRFENKSDDWGLGLPSFSNGAVFVDLDNDGDLDYVVNNIHDEAFVFENKSDHKNQSITIDLEGPLNNPTGIGAKVVLYAPDGQFQQQTNYHTRGYMSSVDDRLFFGLGNEEKVHAVEVLWPDGKHQRIDAVTPNTTLSVNYSDAVENTEEVNLLPSPIRIENTFSAVESTYTHKQPELGDFQIQRLLGAKISEQGPRLQKADFNKDELDDWVVFGAMVEDVQWNIQQSDGSFEVYSLADLIDEELLIETGVVADVNNDGYTDLIVISTHNEYQTRSYYSVLHFIINKGGHFELSDNYKLDTQVSDVTPIDMNGDGFVELFLSGKVKIFEYPHPDPSMLLIQADTGWEKLDDKKLDYGNRKLGLTFAKAYDFDADGFEDLIIGGPFRPVEWMHNQNGESFVSKPIQGFENKLGWWRSLRLIDYDNDGDQDLFLGNIGQNHNYHIDADKPLNLLVKDFDQNGFEEPILFASNKNQEGDWDSYPVSFWGNLYGQSPYFRNRFESYHDFATATLESITAELDVFEIYEINYDSSVVLQNQGNASVAAQDLPFEAQWAPVYGFEKVGGEDKIAILIVGNDYGNEPFFGALDALNGLQIDWVNDQWSVNRQSNFHVTGNARDLIRIKKVNSEYRYITSQNNDKLVIYDK